MRATLRRLPVQLVWIALALYLLWFALQTVSFAEVWAQLRRLRPGQIAALVLVNGALLFVFSARWWLLLYAQGYRIPYSRLVGYRIATFAVSYFTPGPHIGGEPLQVYYVVARHGAPVAVALTAVVLDKLVEMTVNFAVLAIGIVFVLQRHALPGWLEGQLLVVGGVLLAAPAWLLAAMGRGRRPISGALGMLFALGRRISRRADEAGVRRRESQFYRTIRQSEEQGAQLFRKRPRLVWMTVGLSLVSWVGIIGEFWLMTTVLGLGLSLSEAVTALVAARVAILLPLPAALGALEASQALAMRQLGLAPAAGVSLSLLIRARDLLVGAAGLWFGGLEFWRRRKSEKRREAVTG